MGNGSAGFVVITIIGAGCGLPEWNVWAEGVFYFEII